MSGGFLVPAHQGFVDRGLYVVLPEISFRFCQCINCRVGQHLAQLRASIQCLVAVVVSRLVEISWCLASI